MLIPALHFMVSCYTILILLISPCSSPFDIKVTHSLYKTYMIKPNSWIHFLFLKRNRYSHYLHIKQNAVIVISFWIYFIINTVICSFIIFFETIGLRYLSLKIVAAVLMGIYVLIVLIVNIILVIQSKKIEDIELKLPQKDLDELMKEIESLVPHFYDETFW